MLAVARKDHDGVVRWNALECAGVGHSLGTNLASDRDVRLRPKADIHARCCSRAALRALQSPLSHAYAAFTVDSNVAPYLSSSVFVSAASSFSIPSSSRGIRLSRTAAITRLISPAACAGVWNRTRRFIFSGLSGAWQSLHVPLRIASAKSLYVVCSFSRYGLSERNKPLNSAGLGCGSPLSSIHIHLPSNAGVMRDAVLRRGSAPSWRENCPTTIFDVCGSIQNVIPLARW